MASLRPILRSNSLKLIEQRVAKALNKLKIAPKLRNYEVFIRVYAEQPASFGMLMLFVKPSTSVVN